VIGFLSPSTYLAVAGVCAGFENIEWRRGRYYVTQQGVCFQCSESYRAGICRSR
jgi:hypothetical protein